MIQTSNSNKLKTQIIRYITVNHKYSDFLFYIWEIIPKTPRCYFLLKHYSICHKNITVIDTVLLPLLPLLPQLASSFYFSSVYHLLRWSNSAIKLNCEQTSLLLGKDLQQRVPSTQFHFRSLLLHPFSNLLSHQTTVPSIAFNSP